jgi:hypothetical protein
MNGKFKYMSSSYLKIWKSLFKITDYHRWQLVHGESEGWLSRSEIIALSIPSNSSVLDLGAGSQSLKRYLQGCIYQPCDLFQTTPDTLICDFNKNIYPHIDNEYDFVVCNGLLEYIREPKVFLNKIIPMGRKYIISYAIKLPTSSQKWRLSMGWFNHYYEIDLENLFNGLGFNFKIIGQWNDQNIYLLKHSSHPEILLD